MAKTRAQSALDKLNEKYGLTTPKGTTAKTEEKQSKSSASPFALKPAGKSESVAKSTGKAQSALEKLNIKYGLASGESTTGHKEKEEAIKKPVSDKALSSGTTNNLTGYNAETNKVDMSAIYLPKYTSANGMTQAEYEMRRSSSPSMPAYGSYEYYKNREEALRPIMEEISNDFDRRDPTYKAWVKNYEAGLMPDDANEAIKEKVISLSKKFKYQDSIIAEYTDVNEQLKKFDNEGVHYDERGEIDAKSGAEESKYAKERYRTILSADPLTTLEMTQGFAGQLPEDQQKGYEQRESMANLGLIEADKEEAYNYYAKNRNNVYEDNKSGRFAGNYKIGRIGIKSNQAGFTSYNASSDDIEASEVYQILSERIQNRNEETFKNNGATDEAIAIIGQYAPQGVDQLVYGTIGKVVGALVGSKRVGSAIATASYMHEQTAGATYVRLLQESDLSVEDAKKLASDEALASAAVEFGLDFATGSLWSKIGSTSGVNKAMSKTADKLTKALISTGISEKGAKTILNIAKNTGKLTLHSMGEGLEEGWQEGISITADRYATEGETASPFKLLVQSLYLPQYSQDDFNRMGKSFLGGAIIGFGQGGVGAVSSYGINKTLSKIADTPSPDVSQDVNVIAPSEQTAPATLEQAAKDVVASRNAVQSAENEPISNVSTTEGGLPTKEGKAPANVRKGMSRGIPLAERLEAQSRNNEPIAVEDVKKATGFGEYGSKLIAEIASSDGVTFRQAEKAVKNAYMAGFADVDSVKVDFVTDTQVDAFYAGKKDRVMQDLSAKESAKNATVYEGIFTENEYTKNWSKATKTMVATVAKHFGMDISVVDKIIANEHTGAEANAEHKDGKVRISNDRDASKLIHALIMHESGHRMEQMATDEWNVLANALYERAESLGRATKLGVSQGLEFDAMKDQHDAAGVTKDTRGYFGEVVMRELETIFSSTEEFNSFVAEIESNQQVKSAWGKFVQWLSELIEDLKRAWSQRKMTAEEKVEAKKALDELERIKELYAEAYTATRDAVAERAKEVQDEKTQKNTAESGTEKIRSFSFRDSKSGSANDLLTAYNEELTRLIEQRGDYIVDSFEKLKEIVNIAFDNPQTKATAYFGIIPTEIISKIEKTIPNLPRALNGVLFKTGKDYSIATTLDSIRHIADEKSLTKEEIIDYLDRMTDTIVEFDTVTFDYYYEKGNKMNGLLFKKTFDDGVLISFEIVSNKKRSLNLQTLYMQKGDYIKKKSAETPLMEKPSADAQGEGRSNFTNSISQTEEKSQENLSDFSLKENNDVSSKDRKELLDIIEHLKGEFETTKFAKADPKKLAKMTRDLLKEYSSKAEYDETFKAIDELYQYMANGEDGHPPVWKDVYNRAYNIAQGIVGSALVVDDYTYQEYKNLREYLRNTPMKFNAGYDSVPSSYENFNDFRKRNMGRLKFTKAGMSIDSVYQELASLYPEFFDSEEQLNTADQLQRIIDVLDEIRPTEVNPFDRQIEQVSMYLASDITSRFFDIPQAKPTFADKAERRVVEARVAGAKKVESVREQRDVKIKKLIEAQKEKTKKQLDKIRRDRDSKVKKEQEKRREAISKMGENQKAKVLRARIMRHTSELSRKLINPTDNQHIPNELRGAVAKLLESINLESNYTKDVESGSYKKNDEGLPTKRTKAFEELRKLYKDIASSVVVDPDLLGENGLLSDVILLADKRIADMTSTELETVWQAIRAIEASVSTANKIFSQGKFTTILEVAEALREDNSGKKEKIEFKGVLGKGKDLATLNMLTPETYFHFLGNAGDSIFRMMRDAQDKHISIMKEVAGFTRKKLKDVKVKSLEKTLHTVKLGGEEVQLSTAQLMELYALMKRKQASEHILIGGILPDVTKGKGAKLNTRAEPIRNVSVTEISEAISQLTDEQRKIADELQKFTSTVLSEYGNEASMNVYNYEKFNEENYWPIRTNKQEVSSDVGKDTAVITVANKGMAKGTKPHANNSVCIGSIFDTFASHSSDMATYAAWLGTSEDVNRIRNFVFWENGVRTGTVKGILDTVHGAQGKGSQYLENLLADIAIGVKGTDNLNPFDKLVGNYKAASVGANHRVVIQQPTAILRAMDMISPVYLAEGAVRPLKGWVKAKKYAPIAQWKDWGYFDINTGRQMKDVIFNTESLLEKTKQVGMWGASMADSVSWGLLWNAVEAETKARHNDIEVGSEKYYEVVAKRFTEIVDHTQVVDGILQRSEVMRSADGLMKMATSFMGEPTKQYNMIVSAAYDAKNLKGDARKKAVTRLGRTAMSLAVAGIINACAQSIIDAMRDDDKEKKYWEKWLTALVGDGEETKWYDTNLADTANPFNYVPFAKDVVSIFRGYDVKRMDTEAITKVIDASKNMYKAVTGTGKYTIAEASAQIFVEIARVFGLPVANVKRDIKSAVMSTAIQTDNYLMQYRMEKAMLNINYAGNSKNFMDILFNAYNNDREAYEFIYNDMLKSGYDADKIQSGMETRMKKAEGVNGASGLSKRYMPPDDERKYDRSMNEVKSSHVWKSASASQKKEAEADLYDFLTSTSEDMIKTRAEARAFGVDETEYTLWQLAIEMADQPKGQKGSGSYDLKEKAEAINSLNLSDEEIAYFFGKGLSESSKEELNETLDAGIDLKEYVNFKAATSEMKADKNAKGNSIPNSKKRKVVNYLNNANLTDEEWAYFYYEIMNYKK